MSKKLLLILFFIPLLVFSQEDANLWSGISISKKYKDFNFGLSEEIRLNENFTLINKTFTELTAEYKIIKSLRVGFGYRFNQVNKFEYGGFVMNHRINFDLTYKNKFNYFKFAFRTRYQQKFDALKDGSVYNRNKLTIKYDLDNPFEPYIASELFYQFNNVYEFNKSRISVGVKYKISDNSNLKAFYILQQEFNVSDPIMDHIYGIGYSFEL